MLPHLRLVLVAWCAFALLRLVIARIVRPGVAARVLSTALVSAGLATILVYYAAVLLGLHAWGRVISWQLIRSYGMQAPALADALGFPIAAALAVLLVACSAVFALVWVFSRSSDWIAAAGAAPRPGLFGLAFVAGAAGCFAEVYEFRAHPPVARMEPVSLTFFPLGVATLLQNIAIDPMRAERLDAHEDAARAAYRPNPSAARRNVILIVVDALRTDRIGAYGYTRGTTPNLDRLARSSGAFAPSQIRAACTASLCGLLSLLTSRYVHEFSSRPFTLQQVLSRHGYRTSMILSGDHAGFYGLRQLFGPVDEYFDASLHPGTYMNEDLAVLDRTAALPPWDGKPVMIQFHLMSAHVLGRRLPEHARFSPAASYAIPTNRRPPLADNFYDNGVVQADAVTGRLLEILRGKGYLGDALVVVTADHGESLGEGGRWLHAHTVAEEAVRVPLLMVGAWGAHARHAHVVGSQVDIAPTILGALRMPAPDTWSGVDLLAPSTRQYTYLQEGYATGLIDSRDPRRLWKYWADSRDNREYAFDLTADPRETTDVMAAVPEALKRAWRRELLRIRPGGIAVDEMPAQ